jgi:hypothetical protein
VTGIRCQVSGVKVLIPETETTTSEGRAFIRRRLVSPWPLEHDPEMWIPVSEKIMLKSK